MQFRRNYQFKSQWRWLSTHPEMLSLLGWEQVPHRKTISTRCKALGPVWHQSDRLAQRIPDKLRHLDTEATWSKSGYHGWVYGYDLHLTCTQNAWPMLIQVINEKAELILNHIQPQTLATDNSYAKAMRIRHWAKRGVALLSPAFKWTIGRYAKAYHRFINQPFYRQLLAGRRTSVEPCFDLTAKILGTQAKQKQLPISGLR